MSEIASAAPTSSPSPGAEASNTDVETAGSPGQAAPKSTTPSAEQQIKAVTGGDAGGPKKETPAEKRIRLAGKVDGKEEIWEGTESEMIARLQKSTAAEKRMAQAAEERKKEEAKREKVKKDPNAFWEMAKEYGIEDVDTLAEKRLLEKYQLEQMSEEQRAAHEKDQKLAAYEKAEAERKAHAEAQRMEQLESQVFQRTERMFTDALAKTGLPGSMEMLHEMAQIALANQEYGYDMSVDEMALEIKDREADRTKKFQSKFIQKDGEDLLSSMGDEWTEKVRNALMARARGRKVDAQSAPKTPPTPSPDSASADGIKRDANGRIPRDEWKRYLKSNGWR